MTTDYQGNSKKTKAQAERPTPERITTGEVLLQKKSLGGKFRDFFIATDVKSVVSYVVWDVCLPALKNMVVDGASRGIEKMLYGDRSTRQGPGYRATYIPYQTPVQRSFSGGAPAVAGRGFPGQGKAPIDPRQRQNINTGIVYSSKDEADGILEHMAEILDQYQFVTVGDLYNLSGLQASHVDEKWGWVSLGGSNIQQINEGYLLDLPPAQPLQ